MPAGINVEDDPINDGFVLVEFVDPSLKGPALKALTDDGGPYIVEKLSREKGAERVRYRVPEGNAVAAGLIAGSGTDLDNVTQFGATDPTGIVLPTVPITHDNIHAPVIRRGTYRGGDDGDHITQPGNPVNPAIAAPTQTEVADYVHSHEHTLKEREGRDPDNDGVLGFTGHQPLVIPTVEGTGDTTGGVSPFAASAAPLTGDAPQTEAPDLSGTLPDHQEPAQPQTQAYPDGEPSLDWRRPELDAYALDVKHIDTTDKAAYPNKDSVLDAIENTPTPNG